MNSGNHNPYAPPVGEVRHPPLAYPLGKLTIPWLIALNIGIWWAVGSLFTYVLSFYFSGRDLNPFLESLISTRLVQDTDDLAGLLCYSVSFGFGAIYTAYRAFRAWHTWGLDFPPFRSSVKAFLRSSVILAPAWIVAGLFFEVYRRHLPGDGNWPAIACLSGIASFHWFYFQKLLAQILVAEAEE